MNKAKVFVLGLGQGSFAGPTEQALRALRQVDTIIGYSSYVERVSEEWSSANRIVFDNGEENIRAEKAMDLAMQGNNVAVVCGGDPGIYGMAAKLVELNALHPEYQEKIEVSVIPGVTAAQALAARFGALLGEDFCVISLSDIIRDTDGIMHRLESALTADFTVAIYNPASQNRRNLLMRSVKLLRDIRGIHCPVVIGKRIGFADEKCSITKASSIDISEIDMNTTIIIPSSSMKVNEKMNCIYPMRKLGGEKWIL